MPPPTANDSIAAATVRARHRPRGQSGGSVGEVPLPGRCGVAEPRRPHLGPLQFAARQDRVLSLLVGDQVVRQATGQR